MRVDFPPSNLIIMLTLRTVRQLKESLEYIIVICDELLKTRDRQKAVKNEEDLQNIKYISTITPQEYYRFIYLEKIIELNKKNNTYYIYCENFYPQSEELIKYRQGYTNQYMLYKMDFEQSKTIFRKFVLELLHQDQKDDKELFYIY